MDDYQKAYERNELRRALSDSFLDLFEEWSYGELNDMRRRSIDDQMRSDDADKARMLAVRLAHRAMQIADAIDALNEFDSSERATSDDWQELLASSLKYHKVAAKALQELESKCTTQRSDS